METGDKMNLVDRTVSFRRWSFSYREVILGALLLLTVFMFFLFAGLFGQKSSDLKATTSELTQIKDNQCSDTMCFETLGHAELFLNRSYDPCDNFFRFACGGYKQSHKLDPQQERYVNEFIELNDKNQAIMEGILEKGSLPAGLNSSHAEWKLKTFYKSCKDGYQRNLLGAKPLIDRMSPITGYPTQDFDPSTFNFSDTLAKVHVDMWLDAFYSPFLTYDPYNSSRVVIEIYPGGIGYLMDFSDYSTNPTPKQAKVQTAYKSFINKVSRMFAIDAGKTDGDSLTSQIDVFVDDVYYLESNLSTFAGNAEYNSDPYSEEKKVSLADLTRTTGDEIDWTVQMAYIFNEVSITGNTKVVVQYPTYLTNLTAMIRQFHPDVRNRTLHNYLIWRVLDNYMMDLSDKYVQAYREFYLVKYGDANPNEILDSKAYCYYLANRYFEIAMSTLYVKTYFEPKNKDKVTDITETVKTALEDMITKSTWMDQATKNYAITKMKGSTYKIAYPDHMMNQSTVDAMYQKMTINSTDYLGNLLACAKQHRREWNRKLREGEDRSEWFYTTWEVNLAVLWYWDEIIVPAGILQFPMYTYAMPHYYTFGSLGSILGQFIHYLIDERGRIWDKGGDRIFTERGWWSNQTMINYAPNRQCVANLYNNKTMGPYIDFNGYQRTLAVDGDHHAPVAIAITNGIRLAYNAYHSWQKKYGADQHPPGLKFTSDQLFFLAHTQVYCYNRDPRDDFFANVFRDIDEENRVNVALMELPEFKNAFNCKPTDKMVSPKPCTYN